MAGDRPSPEGFEEALTAATIETNPRATASLGPIGDVNNAPLEIPASDRYQRVDLLGRGGMGEVELCTDRLIGRNVALKRMRAEHFDRADHRQRFVQEARVQARLEHPGVVPVYDLGIGSDGGPFFTMKRVLGATLREMTIALANGEEAAKKNYPIARRLGIFGQVCLAVEFAHTQGIIHRDLKPSNVMLGDFGEVYVLDWGLAKQQGPQKTAQPRGPSTVEGTVLGTMGYMSPEQMSGSSLTPRSDIYALGAILFEILALRPFDPSQSQEGGDIAPELEEIYRRATRTNPEDRYPTARALAEAVQSFLDGDRDLELRRSLSQTHTQRAERTMREDLGRDPVAEESARAGALREITAALALDPNNAEARRLLVRLLVEPPKVMPQALERELKEARRARERISARSGTIASLVLCSFLPLGAWLHFREPVIIVFCFAALIGFAGSSMMIASGKGPISLMRVLVLLSSMTFMVIASRSFGPFILFPAIAGHVVAPMALNSSRRAPWFAIVAAMFTVLGPAIAEAIGWLPRSYVFEGGRMCVVPHVVDLPEVPSLVTLAFGATAPILFAGVLAARQGRAVRKAEDQLLVHSWHLRTLLGDSKR